MTTEIHKRSDTNPERGEHEYGDVDFADSVNNKYPIDTPEHIRAAWSYIHHKDNAGKYNSDDAHIIEERIRRAAQTHGIHLEADDK